MPSRFPGMDPFLEREDWKGFHAELIAVLREMLVQKLRPRYIVKTEETIYVSNEDERVLGLRVPDVSVSRHEERREAGTLATATLSPSVTVTLPVPQSVRQLSLSILRSDDRELVTVLEVLSPWNKIGKGRIQYLEKRNEILASPVNLVELDLLRGGERLPVRGRLPNADYYAFVCRFQRHPTAQVFPWNLRQPLPTISIPLSPDDDECILNLQDLFTTTFDRAGYDYSLNYSGEVIPTLSESELAWVDELVNPRP